MRLLDPQTGIETLDRNSCMALLATQEIGRLGFLSGGSPEILPVTYALDGDAVLFATATGTKLWGATRSPVVFEVDDTDRATRCGWSVIVHGIAEEVTDLGTPALLERVRALHVHPWAPGEKAHLVRIAPRYVSGRRISPLPS